MLGSKTYVCSFSGCDTQEVFVKTLSGEYVECESNHGRKAYKKVKSHGSGADDVYLYYWDDSHGPGLQGWWFGNPIGGSQVWAHICSNEKTPPASGWKLPWDARERQSMTVKPKAGGGTVFISGLPGEMGHKVATAALRRGLAVAAVALTGPAAVSPRWMQGHGEVHVAEGSKRIEIKTVPADDPSAQKRALEEAKAKYGDSLVVVDFTHASAVNSNAQLYSDVGVDFVMGTTGGDREALQKTAEDSGVYSVIATNMNKQVLALQATIAKMSADFPNLFHGFALDVTESHQKTKQEKSQVGEEIAKGFVSMGAHIPHGDLKQIRKEDEVHAFHTYTLANADGSAQFQFQHNIKGHAGAVDGALDAVEYILSQKKLGTAKRNFSMMDVICCSNSPSDGLGSSCRESVTDNLSDTMPEASTQTDEPSTLSTHIFSPADQSGSAARVALAEAASAEAAAEAEVAQAQAELAAAEADAVEVDTGTNAVAIDKIAWAKKMVVDYDARRELCDREFAAADHDNTGSLDLENVVGVVFKIANHMSIKLPPKDKITELVKMVQHTEDGSPAVEVSKMSPKKFRTTMKSVLKSVVNEAERQAGFSPCVTPCVSPRGYKTADAKSPWPFDAKAASPRVFTASEFFEMSSRAGISPSVTPCVSPREFKTASSKFRTPVDTKTGPGCVFREADAITSSASDAKAPSILSDFGAVGKYVEIINSRTTPRSRLAASTPLDAKTPSLVAVGVNIERKTCSDLSAPGADVDDMKEHMLSTVKCT